MAVEAGKAYVSVSFDKAAAGRVGSQLKSFVGGLAAIFAAEKIFNFGEQAVQEAAQTQKSAEAIQANFGKAGQAIIDFNEKAATSFAISTQAGDAFAAQMGLVTTNLGLTQKQGATMTVGLEKLAGSFGLIKGTDPAEVFGKLQKALLGNTRGLKDMGIAITPVAEKQAALALGIKGSSADWTAAQKAQIIYQIAMKHLPALLEQAKKHSGDLADQEIKLRAQFSNLKEEIGAALIPILTRFFGFISKNAPKAIADLKKGFAEAKPFLSDFVTAVENVGKAFIPLAKSARPVAEQIGKIAGGAIIGAFILLTKAIQGVADMVKRIPLPILQGFLIFLGLIAAEMIVLAVATGIADFAVGALVATIAILTSPITLIVVAIALVVVALIELYRHSSTARTIINAAWREILAVGRRVWSTISSIITNYIHVIRDVIRIALALIHGNWSQAWNAVKQLVSDVLKLIVSILRAEFAVFLATAGRLGLAILNGIKNALVGVGQAVAAKLGGVKDAIFGIARSAAGWAYNIGRDIVTGIVQGIVNNAISIKDALVNAAKDALDAAKSFLHIGSPSRLYADEVGAPISQGVAMGITDNAHHITNALGAAVAPMSAGGYGVHTAMNGGMGLDINVWLDGHRIDDRVEAKMRRSTKAAQAGQRWSHA